MGNSFWSDPSVEPKRVMRWIMNINGIPEWIIKASGKPSFVVGEAKHRFINHTFWFPGGIEWEPITIKLVDPVAPDASRTMMNILYNSGYRFPQTATELSTISKKKAVEALGNVVISQLGPEGDDIVEQWQLKNGWVQKVNFGELNYESEDLTELEMVIRYDFAEMIVSGPSGVR